VPNQADGTIALDVLKAKIRSEDVHYPVTKLICLENTHNYCGGKVLPLSYLDQMAALSQETGIPLHMDGARLANAAAALGVPMSRLLRGFASSTLCLSKSLSAPIGSLLAGTVPFIHQARRTRKVLGGGMRQVGVIAAAGLVAVRSMIQRLPEDHKRARTLATAINDCNNPAATVDLENLHSNIMLVDLDPKVVLPDQFCARMAATPEAEVSILGEPVSALMFPMSASNVRMVLHVDVSQEDVDLVAKKLTYVIGRLGQETAEAAGGEVVGNGDTRKPLKRDHSVIVE